MRTIIISILTLFAFNVSAENIKIIYPEWQATSIAEGMSGCGDNGSSAAGTFDVNSFKPELFMEDLKKNNSCDHKISKSRKDAIETYKYQVSEENTDSFSSYDCVSQYAKHSSDNLIKYMNEPSTIAVFSKVYDDKGDSESCAVQSFYVFRKSGTVLNIEFNYTD